MTYLVRTSDQVTDFARRLAPGPRQAIRQALTDLRDERGDLKALSGEFKGFYRARIGRYRIIFRYLPNLQIEAVFAADREVVYDVFASEMASRLQEASTRYSWLKLDRRTISRRRRIASGGSHRGVSR